MRFQLQFLALFGLLIAALQAQEVCRVGPIDLTFVIDGSKNVLPDDFQLTLTDASTVTDESLQIGPTEMDSREAMVVFHGVSDIKFPLDNISNADVKGKINAIQYPTQQTGVNIALGMDAATRNIFNHAYPPSRTAKKFMIIVAGSNDHSDVRAERSLASEIDVIPFAIGITNGASSGEAGANRKQLVTATGDPNNVIIITDYTKLLDALRKVMCAISSLVPPPTTPAPTTTTTTAPSEGVKPKTARGCDCDYRKTWLDLVFVLDSSQELNRYDFLSVRNFAATFIRQIPVSQDTTGPTSRVGIVNVAKEADVIGDLHSYADSESAYQAMRNVQYKGQEVMNLKKGLMAARDMINNAAERPNVKKVVIVFTNKDQRCTYQQPLELNKQKITKPSEDDDNPCRVAANLVENNVIVFMVGLKYDKAQRYPILNLGSHCFHYNFDSSFAKNFIDGICKANCYCLPPYVQYKHDDNCVEYGECLYVYQQTLNYDTAEYTCTDSNSSLVDVYSHDKELFIDEIQKQHNVKGSWLALKETNGQYQWNGVNMNSVDYHNWAPGQPQPSAGSCVAYNPSEGWVSEDCYDLFTVAHFVGQKRSCDALHYCDFNTFSLRK